MSNTTNSDAAKSAIPSDEILASLHVPEQLPSCSELHRSPAPAWKSGRIRRCSPREKSSGAILPLPPPEIRLGYAVSDQQYLDVSNYTGTWLKRCIKEEGISLQKGTAILDWGCAAGRVIRQFADHAESCEVWGTDVDARKISWDKANLSPPFRFVTCTAYPHLPFEDNRFTLVYGISVFTHILHLADMWLQELCRIIKPGGYALMTILDENSWVDILADPRKRQVFSLGEEDLPAVLPGDGVYLGTVAGDTGNWRASNVFYSSDFIRREWSQHFEVVRMVPRIEWYQTLVVMRKCR